MGKKKNNEGVLCKVCATGAYMSIAGIPVTVIGFLTHCAPVKIGGIIATDVGVVVRAVSDVLLEKCANDGIDYHCDSDDSLDDEQLDVDIYMEDIDDDDDENADTYFEATLNEAINKKEKKTKKKSEETAEAEVPVEEE